MKVEFIEHLQDYRMKKTTYKICIAGSFYWLHLKLGAQLIKHGKVD